MGLYGLSTEIALPIIFIINDFADKLVYFRSGYGYEHETT
jgi:hypothetical protein